MIKLKKLRESVSKYQEHFPVDVYVAAKSGLDDTKVAKNVGVSLQTLQNWCKKYPAIRYALTLARNGKDEKPETFTEYVYKQLPKELKALWDRIEFWKDHTNGVEKIEELLRDKGRRVRQSLFIHAMVSCNFNASEACRRVCITRKTLTDWTNNDPNFPALLKEIEWHRNNLFESSLIKQVKQGNILATIFANRTQNRDRGYSEKIDVHHSGSMDININHTVKIAKLNLPTETLKELLTAIRATKPAPLALEQNNPIDIDTQELP